MKVVFDTKLTTRRGAIYCMYLKKLPPNETATSSVEEPTDDAPAMNINRAHEVFGHCDENTTRKIASAMGVRLVRGCMTPCEACGLAKAKQKNVPKVSRHIKAKVPNERVFLDISTIVTPKLLKTTIQKGNWRMIEDERTQLKFSEFYHKKSDMVAPTCAKFKLW